MTAKDFLRFKEEVTDLQSRADKAQGSYDRDMAQLKEKFGFTDLETAELALDDMKKTTAGDQAELDRRVTEFRKKWMGKL